MSKFNVETDNLIYKRRGILLDFLGKAFILLCITIALFIIGFTLVFENAPVTGKSMQPTLNAQGETKSDIVYINKLGKYTYGDIIVISHASSDGTDHIIKRVIGLAGDKINIKRAANGYVYVFRNGQYLEEDYIFNVSSSGDPTNLGMESTLTDFNNLRTKYTASNNTSTSIVFDNEGNLVLQDGQVFVLGDNRGRSLDSADSGPFNVKNVVGRVDYIIPYGVKPFFYFLYHFTGIKLY